MARDSSSTTEVLRARASELACADVDASPVETVGVITFDIGEEVYAISLDNVREVEREYRVTPIPCVPDFVLGVMSMRGEILAVNDVAAMMGLRSGSRRGEGSPAIVLEAGAVRAAMVVDHINDIADIPLEAIEPPLSAVDHHQAAFISGSVLVEGRLVGLLDARRLLEPVGGRVRP